MGDLTQKRWTLSDQSWLLHVRRPSRYLGNEINAIRKDWGSLEVSMALAFPDVYEVGMSHFGLKILYQILNGQDWLAAERVFCPWVDLEKELVQRGIPILSMESSRPLKDFHIVGFSLQHELAFTNVLTMLSLSGIPFLAVDRDLSYPIVIAGGPACFNPEPVAPIFDAFVIGDGEEATLQICRVLRRARREKWASKEKLLSEMSRIRGVYVPSLFSVSYNGHGTIERIKPLRPGYTGVQKALIADIDAYPLPSHQVVPFTELIHDRLAIEISRGCSRGCRFCQAGFIYRPVRERHPQSVITIAERALRSTGFDDLSLLSLSSGDYSCIGPLIKELMDRQSGDKIALSLPSLRVDSLDPGWFPQIKRVRKTGFTLAPEAGNDRMRRIINKTLTNSDILNMALHVYESGWNMIKLYFMVGLPGETDPDLQDIIQLSKEVARLGKGRGKKTKLHASVATFVPKSHTPFMWVSQIPLEESQRRIRLIQTGLKNSPIMVKWNDPEMSWLEGILARGDRRLATVLIRAWQMGARYDAWKEHFHRHLWEMAFREEGMDPSFYLTRERCQDEVLPWDHIQSGVSKSYLKKEWEKALLQQITADCRGLCHECGVCDHEEIDPLLIRDWTPPPDPEIPAPFVDKPIRRLRLTFLKTESARYLSHLEMVRLFIRTFRRAGIKMVHSQGFHPMPKVSFASALPVGTESLHETLELEIYETMPVSLLREELARQLPQGIRVIILEDVSHAKRPARVKESHYYVDMGQAPIQESDVIHFLQSEAFPVVRRDNKGERFIEARSLVRSIHLTSNHELELVVIHNSGPELKPAEIVKAIFHLDDHHVDGFNILKFKQVLG